MKTTLVICQHCGNDAVFRFGNGDECAEFSAINAIAMLIAYTRERKISYADAGRLLLEIESWQRSIPEEEWNNLLNEEMLAALLRDMRTGGDLPN